MILRIHRAVVALFAFLTLLTTILASAQNNTDQYIVYENSQGETVFLLNDRQPALYTGNYGSCMSNNVINFTRFDAAYYRDNMTVLFHVEGNTALTNESIMIYISIYAYGETRLNFIFDPCTANIPSLCPLNGTTPIVAQGIIPVTAANLQGIPSIAYTIPDFEGQAILRVFANSTESEIACFTAVVTNGNSFSHPIAVGTALGIFTLTAILASFFTAAYGEAVPAIRLHYAHSLSGGVVFAVFQHIFFTGALSMNWPSVLVAWWSNFAWAGGMINILSMQRSIDRLVGNDIGSTSEVGAAPANSNQNSVGGGSPDISQIYKRSMPFFVDDNIFHAANRDSIVKRAVQGPLDGYTWYGNEVGSGLPLPGNYSGFAGTLAKENIPVSNAFLTGLLWFLIFLTGVVALTIALKLSLEFLSFLHLLKKDKLRVFRNNWMGYTAVVTLRVCYSAWFLLMFLAIFEFTFNSSFRVKGVAIATFVILLLGIAGFCWAAFRDKKRLAVKPTEVIIEAQPDDKKSGVPIFTRMLSTVKELRADDEEENIHLNSMYIKRYGWLAARFRRSKWWFFSAWLLYEFLRAIFYAGASGKPLVQVFGLLVIEIVAFCTIAWARPFEGRRLNVLVVYCLGFSKVACVALSSAFDIHFNLQRITTTVVGIVIIVIQGLLVIITLIAIVVGIISSYMSITRSHEAFHPRILAGVRERYFDHLDRTLRDLPREPSPEPLEQGLTIPSPTEPYFEVKGTKRVAKIEDEDEGVLLESTLLEQRNDASASTSSKQSIVGATGLVFPTTNGTKSVSHSRSSSVRSTHKSHMPLGNRPPRPSWSSHDLNNAGSVQHTLGDDAPTLSTAQSNNTLSTWTVDDNYEPAAPSPSRQPSRKIPRSRSIASVKSSKSVYSIPQNTSNGASLRVGGDCSTPDIIGKVPVPFIRSRSTTTASASRPASFDLAFANEPRNETDATAGDSSSGLLSRSNTTSRVAIPLTPAQELDEWTVSGPTGFSKPNPTNISDAQAD